MSVRRPLTLLLVVAASPMPMARAQVDVNPASANPTKAPVHAPPTTSNRIEEVVVTAQKRKENVQSIPIAITAVSGSTLSRRQVNSVETLSSLVPGLTFGTDGGSARISIRGIGFDTIDPGAEARIAYHIDGVYESRPGAQLGTFYDVSRVEVLSGPQGTLYGRNSTGGSINLITNPPTDRLSGYAKLTLGNYGTVNSEEAISGPLAEGLDARLAVSTKDHDGYGINIGTGNRIDDEHDDAVRGTLRYHPTSDLTFTVAGDYFSENDAAFGNHYFGVGSPGAVLVGTEFGGHPTTNPRDIASAFDPSDHRLFYGITGTAEYNLGDVVLKSISAYRYSNYTVTTDLTQTTLPKTVAPLSILPFFETARQFSEELQASGKFGASHWIAGLYFFDEHIFGGVQVAQNPALFGLPNKEVDGFKAQGYTHTQSYSGYGQLDLALTDRLTAIFGGRYNFERITINDNTEFDLARPYVFSDPIIPLPGFPRSAATVDSAFTPRVGLEYKLDRDVLIYATISEGFKSGGFNLGVLGPAFQPEKLWDYEAGLKGTWFDHKLRSNTSAFFYQYSNLQVTKVVNTQTITENAASAELKGLEEQLTVIPTTQFQVDGSLALLQTEYLNFESADPARPSLGRLNLTGNQLYEAPKVAANIGGQYRWDVYGGNLALRGEWNYVSRNFFTAFDSRAVSQGANFKVNAFLTFEDGSGRWSGTLYGRNLTNRLTIENALIGSVFFGYPVIGTVAPPRTFGFQLGYKF